MTLALGLWSCDSEDNFMLVAPQEAAFAIITPDAGSSIVINETTVQTNVAVTFSWEAVSYGTPTEVTYTLELAPNGSEFAVPTVVSSASTRNSSITFAALNTIANAFDTNLNEVAPVAIDVRIKSTIGSTGAEEKYSDVITILVTPFTPTVPPVLIKREIFLVGPASEAGWANNNGNIPMYRDEANDDLYVLTAYLNAGSLKFLEKRGQWAPQYGTDGLNLVARPTLDVDDPTPLEIAAAGYYTITVNIADLTYSIVPFDASSATTFATVGIIGTATPDDWNSDTDLVASTLNPHIWHAIVTLTPEAVKFRANDDWALPGNWGAGTNGSLSGQTSIDGGDFLPITLAGTYEVWFNDIDNRYLFIPQE